MRIGRVWLHLEEIEARLTNVEKAVTALEELAGLEHEVEELQEA